MKQGSSQQRRGRSRGNGGRRNSSNRNHNIESNGPEGKVRGTAQQVLDKYLSLARDAASSGEYIAAEGFYQFAEHYQRLLNAEAANNPNHKRHQNNREKNEDSGGNGKANTDAVREDEKAAEDTNDNTAVEEPEPETVEIVSEAPEEAAPEDSELAANA